MTADPIYEWAVRVFLAHPAHVHPAADLYPADTPLHPSVSEARGQMLVNVIVRGGVAGD